PTTAVPESDELTAVQLRVARLEKDIPTINLEQESEKSPSKILKIKKEQAEKQKIPKYTIKSSDKATLKEYDQKSALFQTMNKNKSFNRNPTNHALYHDLRKALIEDEDAMDKGVADTINNHKRQHDNDKDDDEDPSAGPTQGKKTKRRRTKESESSKKTSTTKETSRGKASTKSSKTGKSAIAEESVKEPTAEVDMDDVVNTATEDVVHDDVQPHDASEPKTGVTPKHNWFKQPPSPPTPDNLTQELLVGPVYNLLKGTCKSSVELEYNMEECFKALTDRLDWNNPKGDRCPFDLTKPPGHLTVVAEYFFNNDLEFLKSSDSVKNQNRRELPMDIPLDRIKVLRYGTKGVKVRKGIMQSKTELTPEQTQQGVSDEVLSDTQVFTMTMEILPEPTSNKLCSRPYRGSHESATSDVNASLKTIVGNSVSTDLSQPHASTQTTRSNPFANCNLSAAHEDDDDDLNLFADETEEEKKATKGRDHIYY
ncbi:hypothetical protein Tco_0549258, partial [Tanacetum coccineum]